MYGGVTFRWCMSVDHVSSPPRCPHGWSEHSNAEEWWKVGEMRCTNMFWYIHQHFEILPASAGICLWNWQSMAGMTGMPAIKHQIADARSNSYRSDVFINICADISFRSLRLGSFQIGGSPLGMRGKHTSA